jgi:hypothetical protein
MPDRTATIRPVQRDDGRTEYVAEVFETKTVSIAIARCLSRESAERFSKPPPSASRPRLR